MKSGDMAKIEVLLGMAQDQDLKIERGLKFLAKLPKNKKLQELKAVEIEAKEFQKLVLQLQKLKGGLKRRSPDHARMLSEIELIEDKEVDLHLKFQKMRKEVLGLNDSAAGGSGGNSKGVLMAAALGMKIGEQGVKRTEEILATLREANDLMDNMQGDILEQRKKLFRIQDQVKEAQSLTNRGKEVMKYFAKQGAKDLCIKILVGLIAVMIVAMAVLTYQISRERDMVQASPDQLADENLDEMGLLIDDKGRVKMDPSSDTDDHDYYMDNGDEKKDAENERVKENYLKSKELAKEKNKENDSENSQSEKRDSDSDKGTEEKRKDKDEDRRLEARLRERMLRRNREVLRRLRVG